MTHAFSPAQNLLAVETRKIHRVGEPFDLIVTDSAGHIVFERLGTPDGAPTKYLWLHPTGPYLLAHSGERERHVEVFNLKTGISSSLGKRPGRVSVSTDGKYMAVTSWNQDGASITSAISVSSIEWRDAPTSTELWRASLPETLVKSTRLFGQRVIAQLQSNPEVTHAPARASVAVWDASSGAALGHHTHGQGESPSGLEVLGSNLFVEGVTLSGRGLHTSHGTREVVFFEMP